MAYHFHTRARSIASSPGWSLLSSDAPAEIIKESPGEPLPTARVHAMWRRLLPQGWAPEPTTVGLLVFGFSVVSAAPALLLAKVALGEVFNIPPNGFVSFPSGPFTYPLAVRLEAGSAFMVGCAAAFAAAGGLALYARMHWGAALTTIALGVQAVATVVNVIAEPGGVFILARLLSVIWTIMLMCLVTGFRPSFPRPRETKSATARSWMEDSFAPEGNEGRTD